MVKNRTVFKLPDTYLPPEQALSNQFYAWEARGRGWQLWPLPVRLEPPFKPFFFHGWKKIDPDIYAGRQPGLIKSLFKTVTGLFQGTSGAQNEDDEEPLPEVDLGNQPLTELQLTLPAGAKISNQLTEEFLIGLSPCCAPFSFELIGQANETVVQLTCREGDRAALLRQLSAYFPEVVVSEEPDFLKRGWQSTESDDPVIVDFALSEKFMAPLRSGHKLEADPLIALAGALADLDEGEIGVLQVLFEPVSCPWAESIFRAVTDPEGKPYFLNVPQLVAQAKEKISSPLYAAVIRVAAQSPTPNRALRIAQGLGRGLGTLTSQDVNRLMPLVNDEYDDDDHLADLLGRTSHRSGMLLSSDELLSLVHLPGAAVRSPKLRRETKKTKAAPALAAGHSFILGENVHNGRRMEIALSPAQRLRHMHVIGASGTGKSTFLLNMILQDIENGEGCAVLDPHGDLIDAIMAAIPERRWKDVILFDPSDEEYPVGFNILSAHSELEKHLLSSDLAAVFRRLSTSWGDQMNSVLGNGILAFLESERGGTLADLRRFLVEKDYREEFLQSVRDHEVVYYWQKEFPMLTGKPQGPLLTRLDIFLRPKPIRYMVAQKENKLDFARIMNGGKIFLAKLSQGAIGEENAFLLGTLLVSKFHQLALSRQETAESSRRDFFLYVDEFHNFVTPSMASILSGARKYHLGLILAHQEMRQIGRDSEVAASVLANPYTRVCFRLGDEDAGKLKSGFAFFEAKDLQNLGTGEAICRLERADYDFNLKVPPPARVLETMADVCRKNVIKLSRQTYATPRAEVEAEMMRARPALIPTAKKPEPAPQQSATTPKPPAVTPPEKPLEIMPVPEPPPPIAENMARVRIIPNPAPAEPATPGRGGRTHKHLQQFIKQWSEGMGWRAEIEKQILDGAGSIDVALEKGSVSVACEISITTGMEQELGNIEKCLKAGYSFVIATSNEAAQIEKIKSAYAKRSKAADNVRFLTLDELKVFVESLEAQAAEHEKRHKGYKVKTKFTTVNSEQKQAKKKELSDAYMNSFKNKK